MGARRGNALSRSGRFTRIGRGSNSSPKPGPSSPPRAVRGGGGIDYGYGEADTPRYRIPTVPPREGGSFDIPRPGPVPPTPGRRGPITRQPVPTPTRPDQRVQPDRPLVNTSRGPGTAPKESGFRNTKVPSQGLDAQIKSLQIEDAQYARNRAVAAQLDAAQQQLGNTGGRVGGTGVMGRPDSEMNADRGFGNTRVPSQGLDAQIKLLQNEDAEYAKNKAKETNRGIATRTVSFGRR